MLLEIIWEEDEPLRDYDQKIRRKLVVVFCGCVVVWWGGGVWGLWGEENLFHQSGRQPRIRTRKSVRLVTILSFLTKKTQQGVRRGRRSLLH